MSDWFDDPFFKDDPRDEMGNLDKHMGGIGRHIREMEEHMARMIGDFGMGLGFDFGDGGRQAIEDSSRKRGGHRVKVEESDGHEHGKSSHRQPIVEEPDDYSASRHRGPIVEEPDDEPRERYSHEQRDGKPKRYVYSSTMSSFTTGDGVQHAKKKTYDSSTGKTEMAEMRRMGDKAVAMKREVDKDGHVTEMMDKKNVSDVELGSFRKKWDERAQSGRRMLEGAGHESGTTRRALK